MGLRLATTINNSEILFGNNNQPNVRKSSEAEKAKNEYYTRILSNILYYQKNACLDLPCPCILSQ